MGSFGQRSHTAITQTNQLRRDGDAPLIIRLPNLRAEATKVADLLNAAHQEGHHMQLDMMTMCRPLHIVMIWLSS